MESKIVLTDGVYEWRRESGYYRQSKVENTFCRYKTTIGKKLRARPEETREVEAKMAANILNRFLELGTATSEGITQMKDGNGEIWIKKLFMQQRRLISKQIYLEINQTYIPIQNKYTHQGQVPQTGFGSVQTSAPLSKPEGSEEIFDTHHELKS